MTPREAAEILGISHKALLRMINRRRIEYIWVAGSKGYRLEKKTLDDYLTHRREQADTEP